jgi:hypothetical protein
VLSFLRLGMHKTCTPNTRRCLHLCAFLCRNLIDEIWLLILEIGCNDGWSIVQRPGKTHFHNDLPLYCCEMKVASHLSSYCDPSKLLSEGLYLSTFGLPATRRGERMLTQRANRRKGLRCPVPRRLRLMEQNQSRESTNTSPISMG